MYIYKYKKILLPVIIFLFLLTIGSCGSGFYENEYSYDNQDKLKEEKYENPLESKKLNIFMIITEILLKFA